MTAFLAVGGASFVVTSILFFTLWRLAALRTAAARATVKEKEAQIKAREAQIDKLVDDVKSLGDQLTVQEKEREDELAGRDASLRVLEERLVATRKLLDEHVVPEVVEERLGNLFPAPRLVKP